jgi:hypothetical protein
LEGIGLDAAKSVTRHHDNPIKRSSITDGPRYQAF